MIEPLFMPQALLVKHQDFPSRLYSENHINVDHTSDRSFKHQISRILVRLSICIHRLNVVDAHSWCSDTASSCYLLVNYFLCLRQELHLDHQFVSGFAVWTLFRWIVYFEVDKIVKSQTRESNVRHDCCCQCENRQGHCQSVNCSQSDYELAHWLVNRNAVLCNFWQEYLITRDCDFRILGQVRNLIGNGRT